MVNLAGDSSSGFHSLGFLPCKKFVDSHFRYMTNNRFGHSIEEMPEVGVSNA